MKHTLLLFFLILSHLSFSQGFEVIGRVVDETGNPVALANVYLSGTTHGSATNEHGEFKISNIKPSQYQLIVSHVNYKLKLVNIEISLSGLDLGRISLEETTYALSEVEITKKVNKKRWNQHFKMFKEFVFGEHFKNRHIKIPNSYNADFEVDGKTIKEYYPFQLNIINTYTGFEMLYAVESFQIGEARKHALAYVGFTPLQPNDSEQKATWENNRFAVYRGSLRHFFKSLINNELPENGFRARVSFTGEKGKVFQRASSAPLFDEKLKIEPIGDKVRISFEQDLGIDYFNELGGNGNAQTSFVRTYNGYIDVYENGIPVDPGSFDIYGHLATEGLYEMLPTDYSFSDEHEKEINKADNITEIANRLFNHITEKPTEKVYLHLAKPYLAYNELMRYQAYVVAGPEHIPTTLSQNLTVELFDQDLNKINQQELFIENGMAEGDFLIADTLQSETFYLRAYTDWMLNFDEDFIELRKFEIANKQTNNTKETPTPNLRFFPEGGYLVAGLTSNIAFEYNLGKEYFSGEIRDENDEVIAKFEGKDFRGSFHFKPEKGKNYYATVNGSNNKFDLPKAKNTGVVLTANNNAEYEQLYMAVATNEPIADKAGHLLIHTRGLVQYYEKINWNDNAISVNVPTKLIADGLSHITYFDDEMTPLAERLFFKKSKEEKLKVSIDLNKRAYSLREVTQVSIDISDQDWVGQMASASVSIIDINQIDPEAFGQNILSNLLLSSDIADGIVNATKYLNGSIEELKALDLILLTKGWRRFKWEEIKENKLEIEYAPKVGFEVSGQIFANGRGKPLADQSIMHLSLFNNQNSFKESISGEDGSFHFNELKYYKNSSYLQMNDIKARNTLHFSPMSYNEASKPQFPNALYDPVITDFKNETERLVDIIEMQAILDSTYYRDLGSFVVEGKKESGFLENQERGQIYKSGAYSYDITNLMKKGYFFRSPLHALLGRLPGFEMVQNIENPMAPIVRLNRSNQGIAFNANPEPVFYLDDGKVPLEQIMVLPVFAIDRIEVLKGTQAFHTFGPEAAGGVIAIYRKTPEELEEYVRFLSNEFGSRKNFEQYILPGGYYQTREFYSPDYSTQRLEHAKTDYRNLIHWEPKIRTTESGQYQFSYYNADIPTEVMIILEGVTDHGEPFFSTKTYQVNNRDN